MKRKLAFLMATVMTLSLLPMNTAFAATSNRLSNEATTTSKKTLFTEADYLGIGGQNVVGDLYGIDYMVDGTDLVLTVTDSVKVGDKISISLTNADFFFRAQQSEIISRNPTAATRLGNYAMLRTSGSSLRAYNSIRTGISGATATFGADIDLPATSLYETGASQYLNGDGSLFTLVTSTGATNASVDRFGGRQSTYNPARGIWYVGPNSNTGGHYYRFMNASKDSGTATYVIPGSTVGTAATKYEIPYDMEVNYSVANGATLTILSAPISEVSGWTQDGVDHIIEASGVVGNTADAANPALPAGYINEYKGSRWEIRIPLVSRSNDTTADIKVTISPTSNTTSITSGTWAYASTSGTSTNTFVNDPQTARDEFPIDVLYIRENRLRSINTGALYIVAPSGFEWINPDPNSSSNPVKVGVEGGLAWSSGNRPYGNPGLGYQINSNGNYVSLDAAGAQGTTDYYLGYKPLGTVVNYNYSTYYLSQNQYNNYGVPTGSTATTTYDVDRTTLILVMTGLQRSGSNIGTGTAIGSVFITGLVLYADENAPFGPIYLQTQNIKDSGVTNQTDILAGTRVDWTISLTCETPTTLVNGRYEGVAPMNADDNIHKTARVTFKENTVNAWWSGKYTNFVLNEQAKYRKVRFDTVDNMTNHETYLKNPDGQNAFVNDGVMKYTKLSFSGNTMTMNNYTVNTDKKARMVFDVWVSVESGYTGDVTMTVDGSAIADNVPAIVIAKAVNPVDITTTVTDTLIGYQWQRTSDIEIAEVGAGYLQKGKTVLVSVTDMVSNDMVFGSDAKIEVLTPANEGGLTITNFSSTALGAVNEGTTGIGLGGGTLSFEIKSASSKPSTIRLTNVSVKIDRTVPVTNLTAYKVVAWGQAIAPNYTYYSYNSNAQDKFNTPGIMADYIKVVSSADDKASVLTQEVKVPIGESYYIVNGRTVEMDAKAYISPKSSSTMVPLRFVSYAFGLTEDQIIWDGDTSSVTIVHPSRIIQFTINSTTMLLNNVPTKMLSPEGYEVTAELTNERTYVPFRALGNAFGIPVEWDGDTQTAIYNRGANDPVVQ